MIYQDSDKKLYSSIVFKGIIAFMRKQTLIFLLLPALFGVIFVFITKETPKTRKPINIISDEVSVKKSAPQKIKHRTFLKKDLAQELLKKAKKKQPVSKNKEHSALKRHLASEKITEGCPLFIKEVDLFEKHLRAGGKPDNYHFDQDCQNLPLYGKAYESFKNMCLHKDLNKKPKLYGAKCGQALFMLKATHAELTTKGVPLSEIFDLEPLIYKYFYRLFGAGKRDALLSISERVLELEPDLEEFKVLSLISSFEAMVSKRPGFKKRHIEKMEQYFEDLLLSKEGKEREGIYELKLLTLMHSKNHSLQEIESVLSTMENEVPNSSTALYYRANLKNQNNKRKEAIALLKKAIELSPNEKRLHFTYKNLLKADPTKPVQNAFVFQLSFKGLPFDSL